MTAWVSVLCLIIGCHVVAFPELLHACEGCPSKVILQVQVFTTAVAVLLTPHATVLRRRFRTEGSLFKVYLGSPVAPFCPLSFWGPLLNQNSRTKNTLIITGLLEEPRYVYTEGLWVPRFDLTRQCSCLQSAASGSAQTLCAVNLHMVHSYIHT